jgi:hypothetical protein
MTTAGDAGCRMCVWRAGRGGQLSARRRARVQAAGLAGLPPRLPGGRSIRRPDVGVARLLNVEDVHRLAEGFD